LGSSNQDGKDENAAYMGDRRNAHMVQTENPVNKGHLEDVGVDGKIMLQDR
jgi:hypothetical protein